MLQAILLAVLQIAPLGGCQARRSDSLAGSFDRAMARWDLRSAERLLADGRPHDARPHLVSAVRRNPAEPAAHALLARLDAEAGDDASAVEHYRAALRYAPDNVSYATALSSCLLRRAQTSFDRQEDLEAALRAASHARWLAPRDATTSMHCATCLRRLGRHEEAVRFLQDLHRQDPTNARILVETGLALEEAGQPQAAYDMYRHALGIDRTSAAAHNGCARASLAMLQNAAASLGARRAIAHFRKSLQLSPDQPAVQQSLNELLATQDPDTTAFADPNPE